MPCLTPARRDAARRFNTLVDALYESDVKLAALAEAEPEQLYPEGDGAFEFERTVSRLQEMRSADYVARVRDYGRSQLLDMAEKARSLAKPDATEEVAHICAESAK